jgi:hypothetical protein
MQGSHGPIVGHWLAYPGGLEVAVAARCWGYKRLAYGKKKLSGNVTCITHGI